MWKPSSDRLDGLKGLKSARVNLLAVQDPEKNWVFLCHVVGDRIAIYPNWQNICAAALFTCLPVSC